MNKEKRQTIFYSIILITIVMLLISHPGILIGGLLIYIFFKFSNI